VKVPGSCANVNLTIGQLRLHLDLTGDFFYNSCQLLSFLLFVGCAIPCTARLAPHPPASPRV
jgi:hypothetical protein